MALAPSRFCAAVSVMDGSHDDHRVMMLMLNGAELMYEGQAMHVDTPRPIPPHPAWLCMAQLIVFFMIT